MKDQQLMPTLIADRARKYPDRVFLQEVRGRSLTYAQFNDMILRWSAAYELVGVAAGDRVLTMLPASVEAACAWLWLTWLRAVEVPCNIAYRGRMLAYLADNSGAKTMVIADRFVPQLIEVANELPTLQTLVVIDTGSAAPLDQYGDLPFRVLTGEGFLAGVEPAQDLTGPELWDVAAIFYTSGTTGPSKGVLIPWGQLHQQAIVFPGAGLNDQDAFYVPYPMHHITGKTPMYAMAMVNGRTVIRERFDTQEFWRDIDEYDCSTTVFLGPMGTFLWQQERRDDDADHKLKNLWMVPLLPYLDDFKERFGVRVATFYGSTEQGPAIQANWTTSSATWKSCGRLREGYPHWEVRVVDEHDMEVAPGEVGELIVRTSEPWTVNSGYLNMPEKTLEATRNGWFHTGDGFMYDSDGNYYFVDRVRDCIRRRGENISSFEVEAEINVHPAVAESAVVGVPSEFGEEDVKAVVALKPDAALQPKELIEFLTPRMPKFMVPRYVEFVTEIPKTEATLRVRKFLLRENALNAATWDRETAAAMGEPAS